VSKKKPQGRRRLALARVPGKVGRGEEASQPPEEALPFAIVGVGASAGGLEAFSELLRNMPADSGMAFVFIQHLEPTHPSSLSEVLSRVTAMPVHEIQDGMPVRPDQVFVIPSDEDVGILKGKLTLLPRPKVRPGPHLPIDFFFRTLADDQGSRAMGVVLSGTGSDGTEGLRAIRAGDGITLAQDPQSARFNGMPESAIRAKVVDIVLPIPALVAELLRAGRRPYLLTREPELFMAPEEGEDLKKILLLLRRMAGTDFSDYKPSTIKRRLARRLALHKVTTLRDYITLLQGTPAEARALAEDILIHVTSFFREAEVFASLKQYVFPEIVKNKQPGESVRVWVAGCSTGEEAYTIAISLLEFMRGSTQKLSIQIFGTDISEEAIERARAGRYPESIARDLDPERLRHFFTRVDGGYQINRFVRELCIFVRHDLASDPPFSRLDMVSCRNVLIYFNPVLQKRVIAMFHFALNLPGFLLLGHTEKLFDLSHLFSAVDKEKKLFARTEVTSKLRLLPLRSTSLAPARQPEGPVAPPYSSPDIIKQLEGLLLSQYAPPGVLVNERMEILHFRGRTGLYLEPAPGQPQHNLLKMLREGLLADVRSTLSRARKTQAVARKAGVRLQLAEGARVCNVVVIPLPVSPASRERVFAVLFEQVSPATEDKEGGAEPAHEERRGAGAKKEERRTARLEQELSATKEYLQSLIEDHQRANDDLLAANDELVSNNEELQSLNEEMETAKEELQSTNEELITLNEELQSRNAELNLVNSDLLNVLASVEIPIVIVDGARRIRRFTPRARAILNLLPADVGRPIDDIKPNINVDNLDEQIAEVIDSVAMSEREVRDRQGRWYRQQIRPYLTMEKKIEGAVLSFVDVDALRQALTAAEWARDYAASTVEAIQSPLVVLDKRCQVLSANEAFYQSFETTREQTEGRSLYKLGGGHWDLPVLRAALEQLLERGTRFQRLEVECRPAGLEPRCISLSAQPVSSLSGEERFLLAMEDITARKQGEAERQRFLADVEEAKASAEEANRSKDLFLATLSHELRTPLSTLLMQAQLLRRGDMDAAKLRRASEAIERATKAQARLIEDLLDVSRIAAGKLHMEFQAVELGAVLRTAVELIRPTADMKGIVLEVALCEERVEVWGDPSRLQQVVWNLLTNAVKFTPDGGQVRITLERTRQGAQLRVRDTGIGIEPDFLPVIFDRFTQASSSLTRAYGGLGLGLAIVSHLVQAHGGVIQAESPGKGKGATFTITLPLHEGAPSQAAAPEERPAVGLAHLGLGGLRILLVEDDASSRETLVEMLRLSGAEIRAAGSAAQAMGELREFRPQLLISDVAMPGEDGYSLLRRIRALGPEGGGDVPAIALTALAGEEDRQQALAAGFQVHMAKPVEQGRLVTALQGLLDRYGSSR
jgi:two-component system, chemotaxis family, CheB/CheR fusion protein